MVEHEVNVFNDSFSNYYLNWNEEYDFSDTKQSTLKYELAEIVEDLFMEYKREHLQMHSRTRMLTALFSYGTKRFGEEINNLDELPIYKSSLIEGVFKADITTMFLKDRYAAPAKIFSMRFGDLMNSNLKSERKTYYRLEWYDDLMGNLRRLQFKSEHASQLILMLALRDTKLVDTCAVGKMIDGVVNPTMSAINNLFED